MKENNATKCTPEAVEERRKSQNPDLTQEKLAQLAGISYQTYQRFINPKNNTGQLKPTNVAKIARAMEQYGNARPRLDASPISTTGVTESDLEAFAESLQTTAKTLVDPNLSIETRTRHFCDVIGNLNATVEAHRLRVRR